MIELRWSASALQYRTLQARMDASGALNIAGATMGPWTDVPHAERETADKYGLALMMIREGCDDPRAVAAKVLVESREGERQ